MSTRWTIGIGAVLAAAALASGAAPAQARDLVGAMHEHTAYSDGAPGTRPADAFAAGRQRGTDFLALTEHSDTNDLPLVTSTDCLGPNLSKCVLADQVRPLDSLRKWPAMAEQADAATGPGFTGIRGFEWTNDRYGHMSVLFSSNYTNAKVDGSYLSLRFFWWWLGRPVARGGGADALAIFNHPGPRSVGEILPGGFLGPVDPGTPLPGTNFNDLRYEPSADSRMVGIEVFNGRTDYGVRGGTGGRGLYAQALDRGWHVGAVGGEDTATPRWGVPEDPKTVVGAADGSRASIKAAFARRRFFAAARAGVRISFGIDRRPMGSRLTRRPGRRLRVRGSVNVPGAKLELVTSGGTVVARAGRRLSLSRRVRSSERWYYLRAAARDGSSVAYSSPIWVGRRP